MSRLGWGVVLLLVSLSCIAGAAVVAGDDGPLAEAGLDQTVSQGATVYLDAGGSAAPDGDIVAYEWTLERPDGTVGEPACQSCERTEFTASQVGTYAVTVIVTDDQGRMDTDTMYVTVDAAEGPEVSLDGPTELTVDESGQLSLSATPGDSPIENYAWSIRGETHSHTTQGGSTWSRHVSFDEPGTYVVSGSVTDALGNTAEAEHKITIVETFARPNGAGTVDDTDLHDDGTDDLEAEYLEVPEEVLENPEDVENVEYTYTDKNGEGVTASLNANKLVKRAEETPGDGVPEALFHADIVEQGADPLHVDTMTDRELQQLEEELAGSGLRQGESVCDIDRIDCTDSEDVITALGGIDAEEDDNTLSYVEQFRQWRDQSRNAGYNRHVGASISPASATTDTSTPTTGGYAGPGGSSNAVART